MIKVIAFDDSEKYIVKGVIRSKLPEESSQAVFEYITDKIEKGERTYIEEKSKQNLLYILTRFFASDLETILDFVCDDLRSMIHDDLIYIPYKENDIKYILGNEEYKKLFATKRKNPLTVGVETKTRKEEPQEIITFPL